MIFDRTVKVNGKWYKAGEEVPAFSVSIGDEKKTTQPKVDIKIENKQPEIEVKEVEEVKEIKYSKSKLNRMTVTELRKLAKEEGLETADDYSGADIKIYLMNRFNL